MRLAVLALLAVPAMAQEAPLAEASAAARRAFALPGLAADDAPDPTAGEAAVVALLPKLEGTWLRGIDVVMPDPDGFDPGLLAQACANLGATLAVTGPRAFELRVPIGDPAA